MPAKTIQQPIVPVNYNIHFDVELGDKNNCPRYAGTETITLNITQPTQRISLHAKGLKITNVTLNSDNKTYKIENKIKNSEESQLSKQLKIDEENELIIFDFGIKIKQGIAKLSLIFSGNLNNNLIGFYTSNYQGKDGFAKILASTHLEPAHAREVFPCIDEPEAKATFDVSVTADKKFDVTSNTPEIERENLPNNRKRVTFKTTPKMSTYLLYLGVGEFEYLEDDENTKRNSSDVTIRIITVQGKSQYGKFALKAARKFLLFYEDYFGIKYPLKKLDLIAVPDFEAGAMENWGAITFREDALLYYPGTSSVADKEWIAQVIAHELVHQWFGNLVTMKWWNDLWLNESFADYMAFKAVDKYYPELEPWSNFFSKNANSAFALDSLNSSHPIDIDVAMPHEIKEVFDAISYSKGGMILRMLEKYIGEKAFQQGLSEYLTTHSYANAQGEDLWDILERVSGKPVSMLMQSWLKQTGHPLVEVEVKENKLNVKQKRFLFLDKKTDATLWQIPILAYEGDKAIANELLTTSSAEYKLPIGLDNDEWDNDVENNNNNDNTYLRINPDRAAFCRIRYSKNMLDKIRSSIELGKLQAVDIWAIHNDLVALNFSGDVKLKEYLGFMKALKSSRDYLVLIDVLGNLSRITLLCSNEKFTQEIEKEAREFCEPVFERIGWNAKKGEKETDKTIRSAVIGILGRLGDKEILRKSNELFKCILECPKKSQKDTEPVPADLKSTVYMLAAWQGDAERYKQMVNMYETAENETEKDRLLSALAFFKDTSLLQRTLKYGMSDKVRQQNLASLTLSTASNPSGKALIWPWIRDNWTELKRRYEGPVLHLTKMISALSIAADMKIGKQAQEMMAKEPCPGTQRAIDQMLERMEINSNFLERARKEFG